MNFTPIDLATWPRREHFNHYLENARCTYSITLPLDITALLPTLRANNCRLQGALLWLTGESIARFPAFRTAYNEQGVLGVYDWLNPSHTIMQEGSELFASIWTAFSPSFMAFHAGYLNDLAIAKEALLQNPATFSAKPGEPGNIFNFSSLPWLPYTAFNLNLYTSGTYLLPIFTVGKYEEKEGKILLPFTLQVHHAVCDGYQVSQFFAALQAQCHAPEKWINS